MEIDYPTGVQEPQLRALWRLSFGDSEEFIAGFLPAATAPGTAGARRKTGTLPPPFTGLTRSSGGRNSPISTPWRPTRISGTGGFAAP